MAVNTAGLAFLDTLCRWLASGESGVIEWQDGKKRRLVFIEAGQITMVQSNLRSEADERLAEDGVAADPVAATRQARLTGLVGEQGGAIVCHPGTTAPGREPIAIALALWEIADALPQLAGESFPRAVPLALPLLATLPWSAALSGYLAELDGSRTTEDVVDFGPDNPTVISAALAVASVLGAVIAAEGVDGQRRILSQGARGDRPSGLFQPRSAQREAEAEAEADLDIDESGDDARITAAQNHFEVLDVKWQDPPETVRKRYVGLAARLHPDCWAGAPPEIRADMERLFDIVRSAWEVLGDPKKRDAYTRRVIMGELTDEEKAEAQMVAILEAERLLTAAQREIANQRFPQAHELLCLAAAADALHPQVRAYGAYCVIRLNPGKTTVAVEEAVREVETIAAEISGADWARLLLGRTRLARGDVDGAQQAFIQTLKLNPSNADALTEMKRIRAMKAEKAAESKGLFARWFKK
ncbi:MAG: hypothetical protein EXR69_10795 [Myxococcales bacterium]|nr:hypothetical protein [Myxococcales bacterium]